MSYKNIYKKLKDIEKKQKTVIEQTVFQSKINIDNNFISSIFKKFNEKYFEINDFSKETSKELEERIYSFLLTEELLEKYEEKQNNSMVKIFAPEWFWFSTEITSTLTKDLEKIFKKEIVEEIYYFLFESSYRTNIKREYDIENEKWKKYKLNTIDAFIEYLKSEKII